MPPEERSKLREVHATCQSDPATYVEEAKVKDMDQYADDFQLGVHLLCMAVKLGCATEKGLIDRDVLRNKIHLVTPDKSKVDALLEKCAVQQETPEKTAVFVCLCFKRNGVQYYPGA